LAFQKPWHPCHGSPTLSSNIKPLASVITACRLAMLTGLGWRLCYPLEPNASCPSNPGTHFHSQQLPSQEMRGKSKER
jgi:hypothetical protein